MGGGAWAFCSSPDYFTERVLNYIFYYPFYIYYVYDLYNYSGRNTCLFVQLTSNIFYG